MKTAELTTVLTIEDLADYLKTSKSTLYKLAQEGALPGQKSDATGDFIETLSIDGSAWNQHHQ